MHSCKTEKTFFFSFTGEGWDQLTEYEAVTDIRNSKYAVLKMLSYNMSAHKMFAIKVW